MYSSMMTPVCTETPKSARKPTPEDTLKWVPVMQQREQTAERGHAPHSSESAAPISRT